VEKLSSLLRDCPRGLLLHKDELIAWVRSFNVYREGKGEDEQTYMSIWDHQPFSIERKGNEDGLPISVPRPCLSVFGTTQPDVLGGLVHGAQNGFTERILFSYPDGGDQRRKWRWKGIPREYHDLWRATLRRLYALDMVTPDEQDDDGPEGDLWPRFCHFSESGIREWEVFYEAHQDARDGLPDAMRACHAKLESYGARLALLMALLHAAEVDSCASDQVPEVNDGAVRCAAMLVRYFLGHACKAHGQVEETAEDKRIDQVVARIARQGGTITRRDMMRGRLGGVRSRLEAQTLISKLVDRDLGTVIKEPCAANGAETVTFRLHPQIMEDALSSPRRCSVE
jgi:hypothetical protein